jgi:hypothetical protein
MTTGLVVLFEPEAGISGAFETLFDEIDGGGLVVTLKKKEY